jgi:hypothetical protein
LVLGESGDVSIVAKVDRNLQIGFQDRLERDVAPPRKIRRVKNDPVPGVNWPRDRDCHSAKRG